MLLFTFLIFLILIFYCVHSKVGVFDAYAWRRVSLPEVGFEQLVDGVGGV